ncbi:MAG: hypothetical protein JST28_11130 [Acidobacteria bacterium]|nr:hypothetical protein [Acidobacteriota bacterium]
MRNLSFLICFVVLTFSVRAQTTVSVAQLEHFLTSSRAAKLSDLEIAERLSRVDLSEELTASTLKRIVAQAHPGPETQQQLEILTAASMIQAPPAENLVNEVPPDQEAQARILNSAHAYAQGAIRLIPDFLAIRETRSFNNLPLATTKKHQKPQIEMHFASNARREIAVRKGREVSSAVAGKGLGDALVTSGLSSWGEFGAMLAVIFGDSSNDSMHWMRWQKSASGTRLAVFRYEVPRLASHYTVDFCCYRQSEDDPTEHSSKDQPAYHGELSINPATGEIDRITVEAELAESDHVSQSALAVQYGHVIISGRSYLCPVRSVAVTELYNADMQKDYGIGLERHVNDVEFTNYRKFGSTARILPDEDGAGQR